MSKQLINFEKAVAMAAEIIAPRWDFTYVPPGGSTCVNYTYDVVAKERTPSCVIGCIIHKNAPTMLEHIGQSTGARSSIASAFPYDKFVVTEKAKHFFDMLQIKQDRGDESTGVRKSWGQCFVEAVAETNADSWSLGDTEAY